MSETKHSPGKWTTLNQDGDIYIEAESRCAVVARIFAGVGNAEDEANAKLIAAAPDLLEALEAIMSIYPDRGDVMDRVNVNVIQMAKEAIKKATQ